MSDTHTDPEYGELLLTFLPWNALSRWPADDLLDTFAEYAYLVQHDEESSLPYSVVASRHTELRRELLLRLRG